MDGILVQTTRGLRALMTVASEGGSAARIEPAFGALRDQWAAAEREAARSPDDPVAGFDARASEILGAAYRPVLDVLCSGRTIDAADLATAQRSSGWLTLAYGSLLQGDHANVERCLAMAAGCVGLATDPEPTEER